MKTVVSVFRTRIGRAIWVFLCLFFYLLLIMMLHGVSMIGVMALSVVPVLSMGSLFGCIAGVSGAVALSILNVGIIWLFSPVSPAFPPIDGGAWASMVSLVLVGALVGQYHDARIKLKAELQERKVIVESLQAARDSLRNLIHSNADGMIVFSSTGENLFMNPAAEKLWQSTSNELPWNWMGRYLKNGQPGELSMVGPDGSCCVVEVRITPTEWDGQPAWLAALREITSRKQAEEALRHSEEKFRRVIEHSQDGISLFDENGLMIEWNPALEHITGIKRADVLGKPIWETLSSIFNDGRPAAEHAHLIEAEYRRFLQTGEIQSLAEDLRLVRPDGELRVAQARSFHIPTAEGHQGGAILRDVTQLRSRDQQMHLMQLAIDHASNGIIITNPNLPDNPIIYANPGFERLTGYPVSEALGRNARFLQHSDREQTGLEQIHQALDSQNPCKVLMRNYRKDGSMFWNELNIRPITNAAGEVIYYVGMQHDVTTNLENQARLEYLSSHDSLTGLYNRAFFQSAVENASATGRLPAAIMAADMDGLKQVNDHFGHASGDRLLYQAGELLTQVFRAQDVVARLGGDEFAAFMPNTSQAQGQALLDTLQNTIEAHNEDHPDQAISFSCGVAVLTEGDTIEAVLHKADMAMYAEKARRKNTRELLS